jgi:hypothetical protein
MRVIQNEMVAFRCPNTLKERLNEIALASDMHVSQLVRIACIELVSRRSATGKKIEQQPISCS